MLYFVANRQSAVREDYQPDIVQDCLPTNEENDEEETARESKFNFLRKKSVMIRRKVSKSFSGDKEPENHEPAPEPAILLNVNSLNSLSKNESVIFYD